MKLDLKKLDAALIFRANGEREAVIANFPQGGDAALPDNIKLMGAILTRLKGDPAFVQEMYDWIDAEHAMMKAAAYN